MKSDLRAELGGVRDPDFAMDLPTGWSRQQVDDTSLNRMLAGLKQRLMEAHQPQAYVELRGMLEESFKNLRRDGAFAIFSATAPEPSTLWIPASIVASVRRAGPDGNLDDLARTLIRDHGATPLRGDKRTLRFEKQETVRVGSDSVVNEAVIYLTPIPGANRRRALQLVAGFGRTVDTPPDDPSLVATKVLFDSCVSTVRWQPPPRPANR